MVPLGGIASQAVTREELIAEVQGLAERLGVDSVPRARFTRETGISEWRIQTHFDNWNEFVAAAGLKPNNSFKRIPDDDLMEAMRDAFNEAGGIVSAARLRKVSRYGLATYTKRFGGYAGALAHFREWVRLFDPEFPYVDDLPSPHPAPPAATPPVEATAPTAWPQGDRDRYGELLNFRSLQHAPINEQGVVLLFGMVAHDLGFVVERVQTGYPDCEAKRRVAGGHLQRVRIEFEFRSRNFNHPPEGCDLIVCWEHNWPDCMLEALELRTAIRSLDATPH